MAISDHPSAAAPTAQSYQILPAGWRDLNALRQVEAVCFPVDAWPLWDLIGVLTLPNVVRLKAVMGEQMVGFVAGDVRPSQRLGYIATLGVLPEMRGRGIGAALLQACEAQMRVDTLRLNVRLTNRSAIRLYEKFGYHHAGIWPDYYQDGEDALIMEKNWA